MKIFNALRDEENNSGGMRDAGLEKSIFDPHI